MSHLNIIKKQKISMIQSIIANNEKQLVKLLAPFIWKLSRNNNSLIIHTTRYNLEFVLSYLKINSLYKFSQLADIIALDFPQQPIRFVVNYNLLSLFYSTRILVQTKINEKLMLPSVVSLYSSSDWLEREVLDMFGIYFKYHTDLRRILTDYGFVGFPLRKDFPLTGYSEFYYNDNIQDIENQRLFFFQAHRLLLNE